MLLTPSLIELIYWHGSYDFVSRRCRSRPADDLG